MAIQAVESRTWVRPLIALAIGGLLLGLGVTGKLEVWDPNQVRLGAATIVLATLWLVAESFGLATFRLGAFVAFLASVILLIAVGENQRLVEEHKLFEDEAAAIEADLTAFAEQLEEESEVADAGATGAESTAPTEPTPTPTPTPTAEPAPVAEAGTEPVETVGPLIEDLTEDAMPEDAAAATNELVARTNKNFRQAEVDAIALVSECSGSDGGTDLDPALERLAPDSGSYVGWVVGGKAANPDEVRRTVDPACEPRRARIRYLSAWQRQLRTFASRITDEATVESINLQREAISSEIDGLDEPIAVHRLVIDGADALVGDVLDPMLEEEASSRLGGWGWVVVVVVMVVVYRMLEIRNGRRSGGPVVVEPVVEGDENLAAAVQRIRMWLGAAELREPAPIPGGEATKQITSLVQDTRPEKDIVRAVASFFQATAFPKKGASLAVTLETLPESVSGAGTPAEAGSGDGGDAEAQKPEMRRLAVRMSDHRTGRLRFVQSFEGEDLDRLCSEAAHFCAERVMGAGRLSPQWTQWESGDGTALRSYQEVLMAEQGPGGSLSSARRLELLRRAVGSSPRTGIALIALSNELCLAEDLVAGLTLALRASQAHPRMVVARYRAGVTACMLSSDIDTMTRSPHFAELLEVIEDHPTIRVRPEKVRYELSWLNENLKLSGTERVTGSDLKRALAHGDEQDRKTALLRLARAELSASWPNGSGFAYCVRRAWRQDERGYWLSLVRSHRAREHLRAAITISHQLVELREKTIANDTTDQADRDQLQKPVCEQRDRTSEDSIVFYDAACFFSELARSAEKDTSCPDAASDLLAESAHMLLKARMARDGHTISSAWIDADPDLAYLRGSGAQHWDPVFDRIQALEKWASTEGSST